MTNEAEFEVHCDGDYAASACGPRDRAWTEIQRYAAQYAQDGPVVIYEVTRREVASTGAAPSVQEQPTGWQPIETAPRNTTAMFVVKAFNAIRGRGTRYTSDPYCVWSTEGRFVRWPHDFAPTHWMPLSPPPISLGADTGEGVSLGVRVADIAGRMVDPDEDTSRSPDPKFGEVRQQLELPADSVETSGGQQCEK